MDRRGNWVTYSNEWNEVEEGKMSFQPVVDFYGEMGKDLCPHLTQPLLESINRRGDLTTKAGSLFQDFTSLCPLPLLRGCLEYDKRTQEVCLSYQALSLVGISFKKRQSSPPYLIVEMTGRLRALVPAVGLSGFLSLAVYLSVIYRIFITSFLYPQGG